MPLSVAQKAEVLARDLGGQASLARLLGVERSTVSRWLKGGAADPSLAALVDALDFVLAEAHRVFGATGAEKWLLGMDPRLGNRRPADLLRAGRVAEVVRALSEHKAGSYA